MFIEVPKKEYRVEMPKIENRIKEIALSFRYLSADSPNEYTYTVYEKFTVNIGLINVICGASGCGKTTLMDYLSQKLENTVKLQEIRSNEPIINLVGDNTTEAIQILNYVGLGEGNLFFRRIDNLSEGQRFRFKIAYLINKLKEVKEPYYIMIDEFGGTVDLQTAKGLAITLSKVPNKYTNIRFVLCCNNRELAETFRYDSLIIMNYDNSVDVYNKKREDNAILEKKYKVKIATIDDYYQFKKFHYLDLPSGDYEIYVMEDLEKNKYIACYVLSHVIPTECLDMHEDFKIINNSIINIKRQVVLPEYRAQGITKMFIQELCKLRKEKVIEVSSALFHYVPVPINCGFEDENEIFDEYYNNHSDANKKLRKLILEQGYQPIELMDDKKYYDFIQNCNFYEVKSLAYEDGKERMESLIYYYYMLMKKYKLKIGAEFEELRDLFLSATIPSLNNDDLKYLIQNNEQPAYAAFSYRNNLA